MVTKPKLYTADLCKPAIHAKAADVMSGVCSHYTERWVSHGGRGGAGEHNYNGLHCPSPSENSCELIRFTIRPW